MNELITFLKNYLLKIKAHSNYIIFINNVQNGIISNEIRHSLDNIEKFYLPKFEIINFIKFFKTHNCQVITVSDRPTETAIIDDRISGDIDLMKISTAISGYNLF